MSPVRCMSDLDATLARIVRKLEQLRRADSEFKVFGASEHQYRLGNPRSEAEVSEIERAFNVKLPEDYRAFLTAIGDGINCDSQCGGAGPGYGLYSIDIVKELGGSLTKAFPLEHSILQVVELDRSDEYWPVWNDVFQRANQGVLPLAHYGCGIFAKLVLTGEAKGTVWIVDGASGDIAHFADYCRCYSSGGATNLHGGHQVVDGPHSFTQWFEDWLDSGLNPQEEIGRPFDPKYLPGACIVPEKTWIPATKATCPKCGKELRNPKAKQCFHCGADWHNSRSDGDNGTSAVPRRS